MVRACYSYKYLPASDGEYNDGRRMKGGAREAFRVGHSRSDRTSTLCFSVRTAAHASRATRHALRSRHVVGRHFELRHMHAKNPNSDSAVNWWIMQLAMIAEGKYRPRKSILLERPPICRVVACQE
jgi:hypothetical protein